MEAIEHPSPLVAIINLLLATLGIHAAIPDHMVFVGLITLIILAIGLAIRSQLSVDNPGKLQIVLEDVVSFLVGVLEDNMGKKGRKYLPLLGTLFVFILLGNLNPLHLRVDIDEHEAWRVQPGTRAKGHVRGNASLASPLSFVRFEPFVIPKKSLTGDSIERVDTRVLQAIYRVDRTDLRLYPGQQMDVFIEVAGTSTASR